MADMKITRKVHDQSILAAKNTMEKAALDMNTLPVRSEIQSERLRLALEEAKARHAQLLTEVKYVEIGEKAQTRSHSDARQLRRRDSVQRLQVARLERGRRRG